MASGVCGLGRAQKHQMLQFRGDLGPESQAAEKVRDWSLFTAILLTVHYTATMITLGIDCFQ